MNKFQSTVNRESKSLRDIFYNQQLSFRQSRIKQRILTKGVWELAKSRTIK